MSNLFLIALRYYFNWILGGVGNTNLIRELVVSNFKRLYSMNMSLQKLWALTTIECDLIEGWVGMSTEPATLIVLVDCGIMLLILSMTDKLNETIKHYYSMVAWALLAPACRHALHSVLASSSIYVWSKTFPDNLTPRQNDIWDVHERQTIYAAQTIYARVYRWSGWTTYASE